MSASPTSPKTEFPWWLAVAVILALAAALFIATSNLYAQVFATVAKGIGITIFVTVVAFALASAIGLGIALMGLSGSRLMRQIARFYVEIIRGLASGDAILLNPPERPIEGARVATRLVGQ